MKDASPFGGAAFCLPVSTEKTDVSLAKTGGFCYHSVNC